MAIDAGADILGLVAKMPSGPGPISDIEIAKITEFAFGKIETFLLTSEITADAIAAHVASTKPSQVQIVSHIAPKESEKLAVILPNTKRVQVIHIEDETSLDLIAVYEPFVDYFLLDSGRPNAIIPELGGTGRSHDWSISAQFVQKSKKPVFLAGGLNSQNIKEAIATVKPYGIDLCSGVRTNGQLDKAKLRDFIHAALSA